MLLVGVVFYYTIFIKKASKRRPASLRIARPVLAYAPASSSFFVSELKNSTREKITS